MSVKASCETEDFLILFYVYGYMSTDVDGFTAARVLLLLTHWEHFADDAGLVLNA